MDEMMMMFCCHRDNFSRSSSLHSSRTILLLDLLLPISLLTTPFAVLDLAILPLHSASFPLALHNLLDQGALPLTVRQAAGEEISWTFHKRADVRESRSSTFARILLVVTMRIENIAHFQELEVTLKFRSQVGGWKIVPGGAGSGFFCLCGRNVSAGYF